MSKQKFADVVVIVAEKIAKGAVSKASVWSRMQPKEPNDILEWFWDKTREKNSAENVR